MVYKFMRKILKIIAVSTPLVTIAGTAGATSTQFSIPSIGDLLGYAIDAASPFLTALWPILGLLLGLGFVGFVIGKLTHLF